METRIIPVINESSVVRKDVIPAELAESVGRNTRKFMELIGNMMEDKPGNFRGPQLVSIPKKYESAA